MTVYLVGAGPGDPHLITVRGATLLANADCVIHDRLANPALLELASAEAERISVGKAPGSVEATQDEINALLVERGRTGSAVVRLKGGDPFVFGRGGEEAEALIAAGIPFEVVPGITSAIAAPAYAGVPVTHRTLSTHVTIVTGHEDPKKGRTDVDWRALARAGGTLVVLMGAARIEAIARELVAGGRDPQTPVVAVRNGTRPDQSTVRTTLAAAGTAEIAAPSAIVIGEVAALDLAWFEHRPLLGRRVVVTRAREQASELRTRLEALGASVIELPTISIAPLEFDVPPLEAYSWVVFTSVNGVRGFFDRGLTKTGRDARALAGNRVAAIGPGTEGELHRYGISVDLRPERFVAEGLLEEFPEGAWDRVLLPRARVARDVLPKGLAEKGYLVDVLPVYETVTTAPDPDAVVAVRSGEVDAITFTSSSTVENFQRAVGPLNGARAAIVSIGPVTSETAKQLGITITAEAAEHTIGGVVEAVVEALAR